MEFSELIENWRSVKVFEDKEVPEYKIKEIFSEVTRAPTAFNLQPYRFLVLDSKEEKEKAVKSVISGNKWIEEADKIAVLLADERIDTNMEEVVDDMEEKGYIDRMKALDYKDRIPTYSDRGENYLTSWLTRNTFIPAAFFLLSARDKGIGASPVRGFSHHKLSDKLDLEDYERPILLIPFGYPADIEKDQKWRRDAEQVYEIR